MKKKLLLIGLLLFISIIPNYSNAAQESVGKVKGIKTTSIDTNTVTIKWNKVKNITGYRIYMFNYTKNKYELYKTVYKNTYTFKELKSSKKYNIRIKAFKKKNGKKYYGSISNKFKFYTKPTQTLNVMMNSQTNNSVQLSWKKVDRANGYKVYLRDNNTGEWTYKTYSTTNYANINNLLSSKTYEIRVRAYKIVENEKIYGKYSIPIQIVTKPDQVTNLRMKQNNSTYISLAWNEVARATNYKVYSFNEETKKWDYCGNTTNCYYDYKKPDKETKYKFRVRAYMEFKGEKIYGAYSNIFSTRSGMDVSHHNGKIDWQKIKSVGINFVILKAGGRGYKNGKIYEDSEFKTNIEEATKIGIETGIYFYSAAVNENEAVEEAIWCIDILKKYKMEDKCKYIAFDFEEYKKHRTSDMTKEMLNKVNIAFLSEISKTNYIPILYANKNYLSNFLNVEDILLKIPRCKIWLAHFGVDKSSYTGYYDIWQFTSQGTVDGIDSNSVDLDIIYF